jgi:hypothetical protein
MSKPSKKDLKRAILQELKTQSPVHKINLIGRQGAQGALEYRLGDFDDQERAVAARAFEELKTDGYIQPTYADLVDPENWVTITSLGSDFLAKDLKDDIDIGLELVAANLPELRQGMWDAVERTSPDAPRQAAHSARELLDQILKEGAPAECKTRRERFRFLMQKGRSNQSVSKSDLDVIEASAELVEAVHNKLIRAAHSRQSVRQSEVRASIEAAENVLKMIFE